MRTSRWAWCVGATAAILAGGFPTPPTARADGWYDVTWPYRKPLTIQATQVAGELAEFPVLVRLTSDADLAAAAQPTAADVLFTAADGVTKLDHEIESYTAATGALTAWVKVPALSSASDTALYLYYGNAGAASQQNPGGVWSAGYGAVWHLNEDTAPYRDATNNANHSTGGTYPVQVDGKIHKGQSFNGTSHVISVPASASIELTNNGTVSAWFQFGTSKQSNLLEKGGSGGYALWQDGTKMRWGKQNSSVWATSTVSYAVGQWYKVDGVAEAGMMRLYINGALEASSSSTATFTNTSALKLGNGVDGRFQGILDEIRISSAVRTAAWIATEYNNQSSPSTFYTLGSPESVPTVTFMAAEYGAAEDAGAVTAQVQLSAVMPYDVVVPFSIGGTASDPADCTITASPLTIPAGNTGSDITVTVIDDLLDEHNETVIITLGSPTGAVLGATTTYTLTIADDDTAGATVSPIGGLVTTEAGGTASFTVRLASEPTADVVIALSSSDTSEGTVAPATLTFTAADWSTPQTVIVAGVDDDVADGDTAYTVLTLPAVSADAVYNGLDAADVSVTNFDDDPAGEAPAPGGLPASEAPPPNESLTGGSEDTGPKPVYVEVITMTKFFLPVHACGAAPLAYLAATTTSLVALKRLRHRSAPPRFERPTGVRAQPYPADRFPHASRDCREKP
mgnify:CR=1 FL=1